MADFATINTPRYRVRYRSQSQTHTIMFRGAREETGGPAALVTVAGAFLEALAPVRFTDWAVINAEYAGADSELFFPALAPTVVAGAAEINNPAQKVVFLSFVGRSMGGSRALLFVFGVNYDPVGADADEHDFRVTEAEDTRIADALAVLDGASDTLRAIDNQPIIWNRYANIGYNGHYQRKARNG